MIDRNTECVTTVNRLDGLMQEFALTLTDRLEDVCPHRTHWEMLADEFVDWLSRQQPEERFVPLADEVIE